MSAGGEASVELADPRAFNSMACNAVRIEYGYVTNLVINGTIVEGWVLIGEVPFIEGYYRFILRHPLNDDIGTAEYVCVLLSDDGYDMEVCQYILIQNDNDYTSSGFERYGVFDLFRLGQ